MKKKLVLFAFIAVVVMLATGILVSQYHPSMLGKKWNYWVLLPIAVFEGPYATLISGSLVKQGYLLWYLVYLIMVVGDIIGDTGAYCIGRFAGPAILKLAKKFYGVTSQHVLNAEEKFEKNHTKTIFASKLLWGPGIAGLLAAGVLKMPYRRYFLTCLLVTLMQSGTLLTIGYSFAKASEYLGLYSTVVTVIGVALLLFLVLRADFLSKMYYEFYFKLNEGSVHIGICLVSILMAVIAGAFLWLVVPAFALAQFRSDPMLFAGIVFILGYLLGTIILTIGQEVYMKKLEKKKELKE